MTSKEKLHHLVEELSEAEAADALDYFARRRGDHDALSRWLDDAPIDDEPTTPDEDEGAREAREQIERGEVFSAEQIRRELT